MIKNCERLALVALTTHSLIPFLQVLTTLEDNQTHHIKFSILELKAKEDVRQLWLGDAGKSGQV